MGYKKTDVDTELYEILISICDEDIFMKGIFLYCESQNDRKRLTEYIKTGHYDRKEVILMASQIGIESGNVEGKLIEAE